MRALYYWVVENITLIFFGAVVAVFAVAWLVMEALRSHRGRDEIFRLRQRVYELERVTGPRNSFDEGPVVLSSRWIWVGSAATTMDGGCLVLVEAVSPAQKRALVSIRVDGYPATQSHPMRVGQRLEAGGKAGTYLVELYGTGPKQAQLGISLRTRHAESQPAEEN